MSANAPVSLGSAQQIFDEILTVNSVRTPAEEVRQIIGEMALKQRKKELEEDKYDEVPFFSTLDNNELFTPEILSLFCNGDRWDALAALTVEMAKNPRVVSGLREVLKSGDREKTDLFIRTLEIVWQAGLLHADLIIQQLEKMADPEQGLFSGNIRNESAFSKLEKLFTTLAKGDVLNEVTLPNVVKISRRFSSQESDSIYSPVAEVVHALDALHRQKALTNESANETFDLFNKIDSGRMYGVMRHLFGAARLDGKQLADFLKSMQNRDRIVLKGCSYFDRLNFDQFDRVYASLIGFFRPSLGEVPSEAAAYDKIKRFVVLFEEKGSLWGNLFETWSQLGGYNLHNKKNIENLLHHLEAVNLERHNKKGVAPLADEMKVWLERKLNSVRPISRRISGPEFQRSSSVDFSGLEFARRSSAECCR